MFKKKWNSQKINQVGKEIIGSINSYLSNISPNQAKTVLKYGIGCNPIYDAVENLYFKPSAKTKKIYRDLGNLCMHKSFVNSLTSIGEIKAIQIVYKHFSFQIADTCTHNGALILRILALKSKNRI